MAAGERKRYRNREFEDLDYDFDGVRRGFTDSRREYERAREGDFAYELGAAGVMRVREREAFIGGYHSGLSGRNSVRQKGRGFGELLIESDDVMGRGFMESSGEYERTRKVDYANEWGTQDGLGIRERDAVNGRYSSGSGEGPSVRRRGLKSGELSSESGTHLKLRGTRSESPKLESRNTLLVENKKRKFTPIVWDREHKEVSTSSKIRASLSIGLPPPPPLPKNYSKSSNYISDGFVKISPVKNSDSHSSEPLLAEPIVATEIETQISSVKDNESHFLEPSLAKPHVAEEIENHISPASGSAVDISFPHREQKMDNYPDKEVVINSDYFPAVNILSSRWAGNADSPPDEGEIADDEDIHMSRKVTISRLVETSRRNKSLTPDYPELKREGLERSRRRLSGSDEDSDCRRSTSIDAYSSDDLEKDEKEHGKDEESATQFQSDSDEESDKRCMPEPRQRSVAMLEGCRSVDEYERLNRINEGTYGVVYRAEDKKRGEIVALKKVKLEKEREGFPLTALREINILLSFHHPSIVDVKEVVVGSNLDNIFMVMEYMEHDVKALMEAMKQPFSQSEVKCLMLQLLEGVKYLHDNWVLHRDLKTSNLLMNNRGELKICDFGLARQYGSPLKPYTHLVVTLWYRAPELLLGQKEYSTAIDMWSLGCIMAELLSKEPLFNGKTEVDQLDKIFRMLGTPNDTIWPGFSKLPGIKVNFVKHQYNQLRKMFRATTFTGSPVLSDTGLDLLNKLLTYDPEKRIIADEALKHDWFREVPLPKSKEFMPTFPAQNAQDRRFRRVMKSPDPLKEQLLKEMEEREVGTGALFGLGKCA